MTITKFLTARLDEDEHAARSAGGDHAGGDHWDTMTEETPDGEHIYYTVETVGADPVAPVAEMARTRQADRDRAEHIARHDPARALREIAAKRSLLRAHPFEPAEGFCAECQRGGAAGIWPCPTLRHLAAVYAGHPDYQQKWAP